MRSIEDVAEAAGKESPRVKKMLIRLNRGLVGPNEAQDAIVRDLKKRKGISLDELSAFASPDHEGLGSGEVFFASDLETGLRRISLRPSLCNMAVMGPTGRGKTNLLRCLAKLFIDLGIAQVKIIDSLGTYSLLPECCDDTAVLDMPAVNFMASTGVPSPRWANILLDVIAFHTDTMIAGRAFTYRTYVELAKAFERSGQLCCLMDLIEYMQWLLNSRKLNQAERQYCERIWGKLISNEAESRGAFSCQRGVLESVESSSQVIVLQGMSDEFTRFYTSLLIARDFVSRLFIPSEKPLIYLIDEAKSIFPRRDENSGIRSPILSILTRTRNANMYWWIGTQEPSSLAHTLLSNSTTKIIFGTSEGLDLAVIQQSFRLNAEQVREIARLGESGVAAIKFSEGYTEPFLARLDLFDKKFSPDIAARNSKLVEEALSSVVPRSTLLDTILSSRGREQGRNGRMSAIAQRLMEAYGREPYRSLTELYEVSGLGTKGSKARKELVIERYVNERDMVVKTRKGAGKRLLSITEKGKQWLADAGIKSLVRGKGGPREKFYSTAIEEWAKGKGFSIEREYQAVDLLLASVNGERVAIEIACRKENQITNIKRNLELNLFQKIVVACETQKVLEEVQREYSESGIDPGACQVSFLLVTELML
jgi:hypothetical protein